MLGLRLQYGLSIVRIGLFVLCVGLPAANAVGPGRDELIPPIKRQQLLHMAQSSAQSDPRSTTPGAAALQESVLPFDRILDLEAPDRNKPFIVGGSEAKFADWRAQVALVHSQVDKVTEGRFCGGTLIAPTWVLTAGHCAHENRSGKEVETSASEIEVVVGTVDLESVGKEQRIAVKDIKTHPSYKERRSGSPEYDFALLELAGEPKSGTCFEIMPLQSLAERAFSKPGQGVKAAGWGKTSSEDSEGVPRLREVEIKVIETPTCERLLRDSAVDTAKSDFVYFVGKYVGKALNLAENLESDLWQNQVWPKIENVIPARVTDTMLCAGTDDRRGGKDACNGDSGGPLVAEITGRRRQIGIVSWGQSGCAKPKLHGVYSRVAAAHKWIEETVCSDPQNKKERIPGCKLATEHKPSPVCGDALTVKH